MIVLLMLIAALCLATSAVLVDRGYRRVSASRCPGCDYDMTGLGAEMPCPECNFPAAERARLCAPKPDAAAVLGVPRILSLSAAAGVILVSLLNRPGAGWFAWTALLTPLPHAMVFGLVWLARRRLTPRAAITMCIAGLLGVTPLMVAAAAQKPPAPSDPLGGLILVLVCLFTIVPMSVGFLIGAIVIQRRWFKGWRNAEEVWDVKAGARPLP